MKRISIGWVILQKVDSTYRSNLKAYETEATAKRYSNGLPVKEAFIEVEEQEVSVRLWKEN